MKGKTIQKAARRLRAIWRETSGVAAVEFAMALPILTGMGMYGIELAYMASVHMQVSQMALSVADNASRLEQTNNNIVAPTVTEADIESVMFGATKQGSNFRFANNGKVILSSLEKDPASGKQFIHWQRCTGQLAVQSDFGNDTSKNGLTGPTIVSMGNGTTKVTAPSGIAVMFVEVFYDYNGIFGTMFVKKTRFKQEAAYLVRDIRDLRASTQVGVTGTGGNTVCA